MYFQQQMVFHLIIIAGIAVLGYLLIPGAGALYVRHMWRRFRKSLLDSVRYPTLRYADLHGHGEESGGPFRFYGSIRAIQGNDRAWCSNGKLSVSVNLKGKKIFLLSSSYDEHEIYAGHSYPEEPPRRISWQRLSSIPEYTGIYISGMIRQIGGQGMFVESEEVPLLVIIYEQEESALLRQAIWRGRQRNEYWNTSTPGSLAVGSFSLFLYFYLLLHVPGFELPSILALSLSLAPLMPFLPPAVFFLYFFRHYWKLGRMLRAERDLLMIPTVFFQRQEYEEGFRGILESVRLSSGERYVMQRLPERTDAETLFPEANFLNLSLPEDLMGDEYFIFGVASDGVASEETRQLSTPVDPAAEGVIIPGNPFSLSRMCWNRARRLELFGLFLFALGLSMNVLIAFVLLRLLSPL